MDTPDDQGYTQRSTLEQVINSTSPDSPAHLSAKARLEEEPEIPHCLRHIWDWFWDLNASRHEVSPLSYQEIKAWSELTYTCIRAEEVTILKYLDYKYIRYVNEKREKKYKNSKGKK